MSVKLAFDRLGALAVTGVTNYGLDDTPGHVPQPNLPALVIVLGASGGAGIQSANISHSNIETTLGFEHLLLVSMPLQGVPQTNVYSALALVDNYFSAIKGDMTMNDNLAQPLRVLSVSFGVRPWGDWLYYSVSFYHNWVLRI